ncbi:hypothetical protein [Salibacter halophilus]|uniref:Lipoprotein n=1 Tax=Salibacter halophilus TaxID=1803916 RepID=A0A6N6MC96_9FLAO|nr:hypothetical protein [Salibacter halophilus]KAB1066153.1 hypothetical protein F3059_01390 [Salibacter halophilus]
MKNLLIGVLAFSLIGCAESENVNCSKFKTGEFTFSEKSKVRILRSDSIQKEYSQNSGEEFIDEYSINWIDSCTYSAKLIKTNHPEGTSMSIGDSMVVTIMRSKDNKYEWQGMVNGEMKKGIMIKLDE